MVIAWVALGVGLLLFEMHHMAFYALFGAIGALAAALVAVFLPDAIVLQGLVAVVLTIVGVVAARPYVSRVFHRHRGGHVTRGVHGGLIGQEAVTLDDVGDEHSIGHVRLAGERWLAISGGSNIPSGTPVLVTALRGTTLIVWPVDAIDPSPPLLEPPRTDAPDGADGRTT
jgi:membrane protein implicated in regulation of membrane protease activity